MTPSREHCLWGPMKINGEYGHGGSQNRKGKKHVVSSHSVFYRGKFAPTKTKFSSIQSHDDGSSSSKHKALYESSSSSLTSSLSNGGNLGFQLSKDNFEQLPSDQQQEEQHQQHIQESDEFSPLMSATEGNYETDGPPAILHLGMPQLYHHHGAGRKVFINAQTWKKKICEVNSAKMLMQDVLEWTEGLHWTHLSLLR